MYANIPAAVGWALRGARVGTESLAFADEAFRATPGSIVMSSRAFSPGGPVPSRYTADGDGASPPLAWTGVPPGARQMVLLVEDADSPAPSPRVHAIAWALSASDGALLEGALNLPSAEGLSVALGRTSSLRVGYLPLDPPRAHGVHHYAFQLFALGSSIGFASPPRRRELLAAMRGRVLSRGMLWGTYERSPLGRRPSPGL